MDLNLQPRSLACGVTGRPFCEGERVVSVLAWGETGVVRYDALESEAAGLSPAGTVACRWVQVYKPRPKSEDPQRTMRLTAESLFVTLTDPATESSEETGRLVRFLALMLERKRLIRLRGRSEDGAHELYEHMRTHQMHEVPAIELTEAFFAAVQGQLSVLTEGAAA